MTLSDPDTAQATSSLEWDLPALRKGGQSHPRVQEDNDEEEKKGQSARNVSLPPLFGLVQTFTFIVTDLADFETEPIKMEFESDKKAVAYGSLLAREMLEQMPDISGRGICVTVYNDEGAPIAIVPIDEVH